MMASTSMIVGVLAVLVVGLSATSEDASELQRVTRSFPYSLSMLRALRPAQEGEFGPRLIYPSLPASEQEREIADIIQSIDAEFNGGARERRSAPILKRYACRFKFCRIFDA